MLNRITADLHVWLCPPRACSYCDTAEHPRCVPADSHYAHQCTSLEKPCRSNSDCTACMEAPSTINCVYALCIGVATAFCVVAVSAAVAAWLIGVLVDHSDGVPFPTKVEHPHAWTLPPHQPANAKPPSRPNGPASSSVKPSKAVARTSPHTQARALTRCACVRFSP